MMCTGCSMYIHREIRAEKKQNERKIFMAAAWINMS